MQNLIVLLCALVGLAAGQAMINLEFEFFNRFGNIKAKQACLGMDQATEQHRRVDAAIQTCFPKFRTPAVSPADGPETLFTLFRKKRSVSFPPAFIQRGSSSYKSPTTQRSTYKSPTTQRSTYKSPTTQRSTYISQQTEKYSAPVQRNSDARYPFDFVSSLAKNINEEVDYFRCVMNEMGITDSNNNLDVNSLVSQVQSMDIATELKADLKHSVTECAKYALCVPEGKDAYPLPNDVIRTQHYLFCATELRSLACVKKDVKYIVDQFNLKGTDGSLDFAGSDNEKVTALLFANAVVGPDDFGLYE